MVSDRCQVMLFPLKFLNITGTFVGGVWGALMDSLGTVLVDILRVPERWGLVKSSLSAVNGPLPSVATRTHLNSLKKVERLHRRVLLVDSEFRWRICLGKNWLGNSQTSSPLQPFPTPLPRPSTIIDLLKCQNQRSGDRKQPEELVSTTGVCCWQLILGSTFGSLPAILLFTAKGERLPVSAGSMQSKMFSSLGFGCVCYTSRTLESEKEMLSFSQTSSMGSSHPEGYFRGQIVGCSRGTKALSSQWRWVVVCLCLVSFWGTLTWGMFYWELFFRMGQQRLSC